MKLLLFFLIVSLLPFFSAAYPESKKNIFRLGEMIVVPVGEFTMGSEEGDGVVGIHIGIDEFPAHKVYLDQFFLDKYETTNSEYKEFIDITGGKIPTNETHPTDPTIWREGTYLPGSAYRPVVLVDWYDADGYCKWKEGKRLPTEEEWEKAARGTDRRLYPWGDRFDRMKANNHDMGLDMSVTVGSFPNGKSPYGAYDMSGNVWEWTASWYADYLGSNAGRSVYSKTDKVTRGGAWLQPFFYGRTAERTPYPISYKHRTVGFRCAKDG